MTVIKLTTPITHGEKTLTVLTIAAPTAKQIREVGMPFRVSADVGSRDFEMNTERLCRYISKLAAIPPSVVDQLSAADFMKISGVIGDFFAESPALVNKDS